MGSRSWGVILSQAALIAVAVDYACRRPALVLEIADRASWRDFQTGVQQRGLLGMEFAVSDDHRRLKQAIPDALPEAAWQPCFVHFPHNALDHVRRRSPNRTANSISASTGSRPVNGTTSRTPSVGSKISDASPPNATSGAKLPRLRLLCHRLLWYGSLRASRR